MTAPENLSAFDGRPEDYLWYRIKPLPETHTVQPPTPPETISADELAARMRVYAEKLLADPDWHAKNERVAAEKQARKRAREERLAARSALKM
jgi:hypothetical protein